MRNGSNLDPAPSAVARAIAGKIWPDVQASYTLGRGVYGFTCAGHGGIVAVLGVADLPEDAVNAARKCGKTELVLKVPGRYMTSEEYTRDSLEEYAASHRWPIWEVWVGEEDCDWALIVLANDKLRLGGIASGYFSESATAQYARENAERWNPEYLAELEGASTLTSA
jgi:hypothetical protein